MANQVFANMMEVSCKAASGKSICAFPDVCFTPPLTPPSGVPVPYPNTGMASDCTEGSSTVQISGQEVMLKDKSYFKQSTGDEAGSAPKKGEITSVITGKVYFNSWSMDVLMEGENVVRHLDMTTHNHASMPGNSGPWPYIDETAMPGIDDKCANDRTREETACGFDKEEKAYTKSAEECCEDTDCQNARKCMLLPYDGTGSPNCCTPQVAHHILPNSLLQGTRGDTSTNVTGLLTKGANAYTLENGPTICADGQAGVSTPIGTHKLMHDKTKGKLKAILMAGKELTYETSRDKVAEAHGETFTNADGTPLCSSQCIAAQIDAHMNKSKDPTEPKIKVLQKDGATTAKYEKYRIGRVR